MFCFSTHSLHFGFITLSQGSAEFEELQEGSTADLLNASVMGEIMELVLVKYQGRNWNSHIKIVTDMSELFPICFTSDTSENLTIDLYAHMSKAAGQLIISIFSPYWIINKTARVLQYRAEDIHVKHPSDFRDVILFSFKKKNIFSKNKVSVKNPNGLNSDQTVLLSLNVSGLKVHYSNTYLIKRLHI